MDSNMTSDGARDVISNGTSEGSLTADTEVAKEAQKEATKVLIFLRPVGEAPGLKKTRYKLDGSKAIVEIEKFLKKTIGIPHDQSIFLYCGSGFSPTPDQNLQDLFDNFQTGGELIVNYGVQEAWG